MKTVSILFLVIKFISCQPSLSDSFEIKDDKLVITDEELQENETVKYLLRFINEDKWVNYRNYVDDSNRHIYKPWPEEVKKIFLKDKKVVKNIILYCLLNHRKWSAERYDYSIRSLMCLPFDLKIKDEITLELLSKTKKLNIHYFGDDQFVMPSEEILDYIYEKILLVSSHDLLTYFTLKINKTHEYEDDILKYIKKHDIVIRDNEKNYVKSTNKEFNLPEYQKMTISRFNVEVGVYVGPGQDDPMH